ncbi:MAG: hypothetical protein JJ896_12835 [Rhodothermales bacterium]|nr:hypothetical protein [Rhodothermales bacterium]MBO6780532.1 hypothetical protein [Rhodothermales bacterium]
MRPLSIIALLLTGLLAACVEPSGSIPEEDPPAGTELPPLVTPTRAAELARAAWADYWQANMGGWGGLGWSAQADEITSTSSAYGLRVSGEEPRGWVPNSASTWYDFTLEPWRLAHRCQAAATVALRATLQPEAVFEAAGESRLRIAAFSRFVRGLCLGTLAMRYETAYEVGADSTLRERNWEQLQAAAVDELYQSIGLATSSRLSFPADEQWIYGLDLDSEGLVRLANSFAARYMAAVPRTPAGREAADWQEIRRLAASGIEVDFAPVGDINRDNQFTDLTYWAHIPQRSMADYRTVGPADLSGRYARWLAAPAVERRPFDIETDDRRIQFRRGFDSPPGAYFAQLDTHYFAASRGPYLVSRVQFVRWQEYSVTSSGPMPHMVKAEMDLLQAEALLRSGARGVELINNSRVAAGLTPARVTDAPGTPRDGSWQNVEIHVEGASLWAKLQHEFRLETFGTGGALAWATDRGWGDLVDGTPAEYPAPESRAALVGWLVGQ